ARWADSLTWLGLSRNYLTDEALQAIASCGRFTRLRTLHLGGNNHQLEGADPGDQVTDAGLLALAESPHLTSLRVLDLSGAVGTTAGIEAVLNSPHWRLTEFGLSFCDIEGDPLRALATSPRLSHLRRLDVSYAIGGFGMELMPLAESEYLSPNCVV